MCGIAGWLGSIEDEVDAEHFVRALQHRGPDATGVKSWPEATLVHTRLSIIDLSPFGAQPMSNEDGSVWTVFNGEIYNHREIRGELERKGHVFRGHSDTEVLVHLYEEDGNGFLNKLRGMFALAIYDLRSKSLILARDRFGIKPLFYAVDNSRVIFASEIRALRKLPSINSRPNRQAIHDFSALFYIPAPETFYVGIQALQPGEMLEARLESNSVSSSARIYHRWSIEQDWNLSLTQATDRAEELVASAVKRQLESDVPLGALLSGGIDSSLVSAAAQSVLEGKLNTFNVRFAEEEYDETWAAQEVAKHIGSNHRTLHMNHIRGSWEHVFGLLEHAGQPFADTSLFAVNAVCHLMRQHVTVALSGDGGDEGFGGYNFYWQIGRIARWQKLPQFIWRGSPLLLGPFANLGLIPERFPKRIRDLAGADDTAIVQDLFCWIRSAEHLQLSRGTAELHPVRRLFEQHWEHHLGDVSRLERLSALATEANIRLTLPNDFLFKVDIASMKESLEVRVPMLDEDLFAFGLSLPHRLKVTGRICKRVLREVAKRRLTQAVACKAKQGFGIPLDSWVDSDCKAALKNRLLGPGSKLAEFFQPEVYRPFVRAFCDSQTHPAISRQGLYQRVIMLLSVDIALSTN